MKTLARLYLGIVIVGILAGVVSIVDLFRAPVALAQTSPYVVPFSCFIEGATVTTQCQAPVGTGLKLYLSSELVSNEAGTAQTLDLVYGTGVNCGTGTTTLSHKLQFAAAGNQGQTFGSPIPVPTGQSVCIRPSAATAFGGTITGYTAP